MSERGSRFQASVVTFGPFGRAVATAVLLGVPAFMLMYGGLFGAVGAVIWGVKILPMGLRDVWRRAALPSTDLTRLRDQTARDAALRARTMTDHPVFDQEQPPPTRW